MLQCEGVAHQGRHIPSLKQSPKGCMTLLTASDFIYWTNTHTTLFSPAQTFTFPAVQEIRQLNMKQEGFVREISDLQETVEWKDKKIGV